MMLNEIPFCCSYLQVIALKRLNASPSCLSPNSDINYIFDKIFIMTNNFGPERREIVKMDETFSKIMYDGRDRQADNYFDHIDPMQYSWDASLLKKDDKQCE